jgi:hypothetical protein
VREADRVEVSQRREHAVLAEVHAVVVGTEDRVDADCPQIANACRRSGNVRRETSTAADVGRPVVVLLDAAFEVHDADVSVVD